MSKQFLVVGSPIDHSKSPAIHRAAYGVLGLDWDYGRLEVSKGGLRQVLDNSPEALSGFSVTMPLKEEATRAASWQDEFVRSTGVANTLARTESGWNAYNTDVFGIVQAVSSVTSETTKNVSILGSGATARSAVAAVRLFAPQAKVRIAGRNRDAVRELTRYAKSLGLRAKASNLNSRAAAKGGLTISTLPTGALDALAPKLEKRLQGNEGSALLDVAYEPWPSAAASSWLSAGGVAISGTEMLIWQAVAQLRIFVNDNPNEPLANEIAVLEAMRHAV